MPRPKTNTSPLTVQVQTDILDALRTIVKRDGLNQSVFVQNALVRSIRNYRSPMEFIAEGRESKDRSPVGSVDLGLDRPDGIPLTHTEVFGVADWREVWALSSLTGIQKDLNQFRGEAGRLPLTTGEWEAIVRYMGQEPGWRKHKKLVATEFEQ